MLIVSITFINNRPPQRLTFNDPEKAIAIVTEIVETIRAAKTNICLVGDDCGIYADIFFLHHLEEVATIYMMTPRTCCQDARTAEEIDTPSGLTL